MEKNKVLQALGTAVVEHSEKPLLPPPAEDPFVEDEAIPVEDPLVQDEAIAVVEHSDKPPLPPPAEDPPVQDEAIPVEDAPVQDEAMAVVEHSDTPPLPPPAEDPPVQDEAIPVEDAPVQDEAIPVEDAPVEDKAGSLADRIKEIEDMIKKNADLDFWALVKNIATVEDLGEEQKAHYIKVKAEGLGICSKCRWTSGCMNCDVEKAWVYVLKWQLGLREVDLRLLRAGGKKLAEPVLGGGCLGLQVFLV